MGTTYFFKGLLEGFWGEKEMGISLSPPATFPATEYLRVYVPGAGGSALNNVWSFNSFIQVFIKCLHDWVLFQPPGNTQALRCAQALLSGPDLTAQEDRVVG